MSTFNAVRNHMALIQHDADSLLKDINRFEEDHEENCIGISQCDKEFAQAKAAEDKFKCKQRKLDRKQAEIQSEQAAKWEQYKIKAALVHELRILCRESYAFPKNGKRALPKDSYDQAGPMKKAKAYSAPAGPIEDDEEYGTLVERASSGLKNELNTQEEEDDELKTEIKADNDIVKADEDVVKAENDDVQTENSDELKQEIKREIKQEINTDVQTGITAGNSKVEVIELEDDEE